MSISRAAAPAASVVASLALLAACGKDDKTGGAAPPERPFTGAPVAVVVDKVTPPETLDVRVHNFADRPIATYWLLFRYYDASGNVLRVKPGTPFEKDHDFMSVSGRKYLAAPGQWKSFQLDMMNVPAEAVRADGLVRSIYALGADGSKIDEEPLWELDGMDWPAPAPGATTPP